MGNFNEGPINVEQLQEQLRGTPGYFGWCLVEYCEWVLSILRHHQVPPEQFSEQVNEIEAMAEERPKTKEDYERYVERINSFAVSMADFLKIKPEQFWADFDPEKGFDNPSTLQMIIEDNNIL